MSVYVAVANTIHHGSYRAGGVLCSVLGGNSSGANWISTAVQWEKLRDSMWIKCHSLTHHQPTGQDYPKSPIRLNEGRWLKGLNYIGIQNMI